MSTTDVEQHTAEPAEAEATPPPPILSQTLRRAGRRRTRVLAVLSLLVAIGATGYLMLSAREPDVATPIEAATAPSWAATGALSDALRALRPGASRNAARPLAGRAAAASKTAQRRVEKLTLPIKDTPLRSRVLNALRADADWIDAVGSTLANPRSPRRADLSTLARRAAEKTVLVAPDLGDARGTVGGTGRLLAATKPG